MLAHWLSGHSNKTTAVYVRCSITQVDKFRQEFMGDPYGFCEKLEVVERIDKKEWQCSWCQAVRKSKRACQREFLTHVLPASMIAK
jgi:hypothetical protein